MAGAQKGPPVFRGAAFVWYERPGIPNLRIHGIEEVVVVLGMLQLVEQELHGVGDAHGHEDAAQHPHLRQRTLVHQKLFLPGVGLILGAYSAIQPPERANPTRQLPKEVKSKNSQGKPLKPKAMTNRKAGNCFYTTWTLSGHNEFL